ncbi:MAG TPA: NAD-binding protein, partial [Halobacteriales archaeon]|nr:NAD-binding protein [Halobacteriales archaeon]
LEGYEDHVVLCELTARGETLSGELDAWDRRHVIVEPDRDRAATFQERGLAVVHGDPESVETLEGACVAEADTVVADADDERNAAIALSTREVSDDVRLIAFAEEPEMVDYLRYAGADEVFSPRQLLGESLANEVTTSVSMELGDTVEIGTDLEVVELPIQPGSDVEGVALADSGIRERTGVNVIGLWRKGEFVNAPPPDVPLDADTILLVAGSEHQLSELKRLTLSVERRRARGTVVVAGFGEVGATVAEELARGGMETVVIDEVERPGVDLVADATEEETYREADLESASNLIIALSDDTTAMLATLVAREVGPDVRIVVRAQETESIGKLYRAGADYVLALATVSGRMIASTVLDEEEVVAPEKRIELVRTTAPKLAGQSLAGADVRHRTGCTVIAVERDGELLTDLSPEFTFQAEDTLVVAGTDDAMVEFGRLAH